MQPIIVPIIVIVVMTTGVFCVFRYMERRGLDLLEENRTSRFYAEGAGVAIAVTAILWAAVELAAKL